MNTWNRQFFATSLLTVGLTVFAEVLQPIPGAPGPDTGESSLFRDAGGTLHLTWSGPGLAPTNRALWHATLAPNSDAWSAPRAIISTPLLMENWADFATLTVATNGTLWAQWFQSHAVDERGYDGWFARSTNGGATWSTPAPLGHEFVSLAALSGGRVMAVWLESARPPGQPRAPKAPYAPSMRLAARLLAPDGSTLRDWVVDPDVCTCCQTTLAILTDNRLVVAYRGHTLTEIRDNLVARFDGNDWLPPSVLHHDLWNIAGCPVNGPAADATDETVGFAWFTAADGIARVLAKFSRDGGATFGPALSVDLGRPIGRLDLVNLPDGSAVVSWLEAARAENEAGLYVRRLYPDGRASGPLNLGATSAARASGFARMAVRDPSAAEIVISYTDVDPSDSSTTQIRTATFSAAALTPADLLTPRSPNTPSLPLSPPVHARH